MPIVVVAALLLAAVVTLLAAPVQLRFELRGLSPLQGRVVVRALFGLWRPRLELPRRGPARQRSAGVAGDTQPPRVAARVAVPWRDARLRRGVLDASRRLLATLRWSELRVRVRLGLDDPADTGRLWAAVGPLAAVLAGPRAVVVTIEPDFLQPRLDFECRGAVAFVPLRLIGPLALLAGHVGLALRRDRLARRRAV